MKFLRIVGARPQFMQAAALRKSIESRGHEEILLHTGQHYDDSMSKVFFEQLNLPTPDINLGIGSGGHGYQTGHMLIELESVVNSLQINAIIVDGDTNSTLAGALAAAKAHIPLIHVEAGLRSFDRKMPEEINRIVADHAGDLLCAPTHTALNNLTKEGLRERAVLTGDLMYDCFLEYKSKAQFSIISELQLESQQYILATIHRAENTDNKSNMQHILNALNQLTMKVVLPAHPRTETVLKKYFLDYREQFKNICFITPVGYLEMLALEIDAAYIFTDSGGVQRESFFAQVPSVILRNTTEWVEQIEMGWSVLGASTCDGILTAFEKLKKSSKQNMPVYGDGNASEKIVVSIEKMFK